MSKKNDALSSSVVRRWNGKIATSQSSGGSHKPSATMLSLNKAALWLNFNSLRPRTYHVMNKGAQGFDGESVYGVQAEMLEDDNMAWGSPSPPRMKKSQSV